MNRSRNSLDNFYGGSNMIHFIILNCHSSFFVENRLLRNRVDAERSLELCKSVMMIIWAVIVSVYFIRIDWLLLGHIHEVGLIVC